MFVFRMPFICPALSFWGISYDGDRSRQSQFLKRYFLDFDGESCFSEKRTKM